MSRTVVLALALSACAGRGLVDSTPVPEAKKDWHACVGAFPVEAQAQHAGCYRLHTGQVVEYWEVLVGTPTTFTPKGTHDLLICGPFGNYQVLAHTATTQGCAAFTIHE